MENPGLYVAQIWHEVLMNSSNEDDVKKYAELMNRSPVEIQIILMTGTNNDLLLRDYANILHISKSTLTSIINRLEKQGFIHRAISDKDKRSYCLTLGIKGQDFFNSYISYQTDIGNRIISGLDEDEKQQLFMLLGKIASYMIRR